MTFSTPWLGTKRVAFVPVFRDFPGSTDMIPDDWISVIKNRAQNDLREVVEDEGPPLVTKIVDRSLSAWARAVSWGRANIDPVVLGIHIAHQEHVEPRHFEGDINLDALPGGPAQAGVLVMLGTTGTATNDGKWSRVAMVEGNGLWLHEIIHSLTNFKDLYDFNNDLDPPERKMGFYDIMSASHQTHPTAFTKNELGWLPAESIGLYIPGTPLSGYILHHINSGPLPPWISNANFAVRIGDGFPYVMVEARKKTDHFDEGIIPVTPGVPGGMGIPSEGVIAYRVQTRNPTVQEREACKKPLYLMTVSAGQPDALQVGESRELDNGVIVKVVFTVPPTQNHTGGFVIHLTTGNPTQVFVPFPTVPNVIGKPWEEAEQIMVIAGICSRISGPKENAVIESQSLAAGTSVPPGTEINLVRVTPPPNDTSEKYK